MTWSRVKQYWRHPDYKGLYNMDDYGNLFRVRRWEVLGRNFCSCQLKSK